MSILFSFFFFFSSRRRHTRFDCDWSSDVCSSDLDEPIAWAKPPGYIQAQPVLAPHLPSAPRGIAGLLARIAVIVPLVVAVTLAVLVALVRQNGGAGNGCHGGTGDPCSRVVAPAFLALRALGQAGQDAETPAAAALDPHLPAGQT